MYMFISNKVKMYPAKVIMSWSDGLYKISVKLTNFKIKLSNKPVPLFKSCAWRSAIPFYNFIYTAKRRHI